MAGQASGKKKNTRSKAAAEKANFCPAIEKREKHTRQVAAIIYFALGILVFFLSIIDGENVWGACHDILFGLFGYTGYVIAPIFIYIAICASMDRPFGAIRHKICRRQFY